MATKAKPRKKSPDILEEAKRGDFHELMKHVKAYPLWYAVVAAFLVLCVIAGMLFKSGGESSLRSDTTSFGKAMATEDPITRAAELETLANGKGPMASKALYHMGQAFFAAKEYDSAKDAFERVRSEFSSSESVPDAVEGLGRIAEENKDYAAAVAHYREISEKWPTSLARRRQDCNIGRCEERSGKLAEAISAYQTQGEQFPDSVYAREAKKALERLRKSNPDLFPKAADKLSTSEKVGEPAKAPVSSPAENGGGSVSEPVLEPPKP